MHIYSTASDDHVLRHCPNGVLLIDDVVPSDWILATPDQFESLAVRREHGIDNIDWHGDVFKVILILADQHPELDRVTITDKGNPQTFVWRRATRRGRRRIRPVSTSTIDSYSRVSYTDIFAAGTPSTFRSCDEAAALPLVIDGLVPLRSRPRPLVRRP